MKGKKFDREFLSEYMDECIAEGYRTSNDMVILAKEEITDIDREIRNIEEKKKRRSKLLSVIEEFDKKGDKKYGANILPYFAFGDPVLNLSICQAIQVVSLNEFDLITAGGPRDITTIALKKLLKHKVLIKMGDYISQGAEYQKYYSFLQGTK
jgi:hypothetical protein